MNDFFAHIKALHNEPGVRLVIFVLLVVLSQWLLVFQLINAASGVANLLGLLFNIIGLPLFWYFYVYVFLQRLRNNSESR